MCTASVLVYKCMIAAKLRESSAAHQRSNSPFLTAVLSLQTCRPADLQCTGLLSQQYEQQYLFWNLDQLYPQLVVHTCCCVTCHPKQSINLLLHCQCIFMSKSIRAGDDPKIKPASSPAASRSSMMLWAAVWASLSGCLCC